MAESFASTYIGLQCIAFVYRHILYIDTQEYGHRHKYTVCANMKDYDVAILFVRLSASVRCLRSQLAIC